MAQCILAAIGLAGAGFHAFPLAVHAEHEDVPVTDIVTIAWLGVVAIAAAFPTISEVAFGDVSIKTRQLRSASNVYEKTLKNVAHLTERWSVAATAYLAKMQQPADGLVQTKDAMYIDFLRDRLGEAYETIGTTPGETVRIALWLYDPKAREIVFSAGFGITPERESYAVGEGMIGRSFANDAALNEADVRVVPSYVPSRAEDPPYRAVLCEPVRYAGSPIGVITADRSTIGHFDDVSVAVMRALAAQCALAITTYQRFGEEPGDAETSDGGSTV